MINPIFGFSMGAIRRLGNRVILLSMLMVTLLSFPAFAEQKDGPAQKCIFFTHPDDIRSKAERTALNERIAAMEANLLADSIHATPILIAGAKYGPDTAQIAEYKAKFTSEYKEYQKELQHADPRYTNAQELAHAKAQTLDDYISVEMARTISYYRFNSTDCLGKIHNNDALAALAEVAHDTSSPEARDAQLRASFIIIKLADMNNDNVVNCADVAIVKALLGKKSGETGFNAHADVNNDGVVDDQDLAFVKKHLGGSNVINSPPVPDVVCN